MNSVYFDKRIGLLSIAFLYFFSITLPAEASSIGGSLESAGTSWLLPILRGIMIVGIIIGAFLMSIGNQEGKDKIKMVLIAGIIGYSSVEIVNAISSFFG